MKWVKTEVSPYLLFLPLCYGVFIAADDMTLVVTILPDMMQSLKIPVNDINRASWLIISFLIGYSATMPIMGRLSDRWGYRATFVLALSVFMIGSAGVALIPVMSSTLDAIPFLDQYRWSIVARVVQSIGAGAVIPISLAAAETLVGARRRIVAFGMVGAAAEAGSVFGPVYAGAIADWIGWEYTFWSNIPLSLIAVVALVKLPKGIRHDASVDWIGAAAFTAALTTLTVGLFRISEPDLPMILLFVAAALLTGVVVISNRTASDKAIPRSLGKLKDFIWSNVTHFLVGAACDDRVGQRAVAGGNDLRVVGTRFRSSSGADDGCAGCRGVRGWFYRDAIRSTDTDDRGFDIGGYRLQFHVDLGHRFARAACFDRSDHRRYRIGVADRADSRERVETRA